MSDTDEIIDINGVKYKKLDIKSMQINDEDKEFLTAEDTKKDNQVKLNITVK